MRLQYDDEYDYDYTKLYGVFVKNKNILVNGRGHYAIYLFDSKDKAYEFLDDIEMYGVKGANTRNVVDILMDINPDDINTYGKYCWNPDKCCYVLNKHAVDY